MNNNNQEIFYSPYNTTVNFIIAVAFFILLVILATNVHKTTAIIFIVVLIAVGGQGMFMFIKSFLLFVSGKPAIVLTKKYFIDNSSGVKISWSDINNITNYNFNGRTFLAFDLIDNSIIYKQIFNPIQNGLLRINAALSKKSFMTNLSFLKGKNADIFENVNNFYRAILKDEI